MKDADGFHEADVEIIRRMQKGDVRGLEDLLRTFGPRVKACLRILFKLPEGDHVLEDAVHDGALNLFAAAHRLDPLVNLGGYYYTAARHVVARLLKERGIYKQFPEGAEQQLLAPADPVAPSACSDRVTALLESLPITERDILLLDIASSFSLTAKEIAQRLGSTEATVYSLRHRTKARLRGLLDDGNAEANHG